MAEVIITITIKDGNITVNDNLGNMSSHEFDPECLISDQIGTYIADHIEHYNIHSEIMQEGLSNQDYAEGYFDDEDDGYDD